MHYIDIIFCGLAYFVFIFFLIKQYQRRNIGLDDDRDDDDGGIEVQGLPEIDLPPGVCLPPGPVSENTRDRELIH